MVSTALDSDAAEGSREQGGEIINFNTPLDGTARYAGLLLAPAEGPGFLCLSGKKRAFHAVSAYFRPFLVFSSNLRNV